MSERETITLEGGYICELNIEERNEWTRYLRENYPKALCRFRSRSYRVNHMQEGAGSRFGILWDYEEGSAELFDIAEAWYRHLVVTRADPFKGAALNESKEPI